MGQSEIVIMNLTPFTFVCPRCRYRNNMEIESDAAWIQVAHWKRDGRCWECAYRFDPLEVIAAFESKHHPGRTNPASSWQEVPALVDARPAEYEETLYGISRSITGCEVWVDFGDELHGKIGMAKLIFKDEKTAWAAYCKGVRMAIKVVEHPEHKLENLRQAILDPNVPVGIAAPVTD